ncbi:hypothetical protein HOY80DRAFT_181101 [Tuber brumale]|nr:hypothetical protein HOY80DRAFT_181101 [Tuber brumale]
MGFSIRRGVTNLIRRGQRLAGKARCSVCMTYFKNALVKTIPGCGHSYCKTCLQKTYTRAMNDPEGILPPRCCGQELTMAFAGDFLAGYIPKELEMPDSYGHTDFRRRYLEILAERTSDPIYCAHCRSLGKQVFIPPEEISEEEDSAVCSTCFQGTCTLCKRNNPHTISNPCSIESDESKQEIRYQRLSGRAGWRSCEGCGMMVSRDVGCAHVVCRCGQDVWLAF